MRRFSSIDTFVESGEEGLKVGRLVANFRFLEALLDALREGPCAWGQPAFASRDRQRPA